jgi:hypothetical protein
MWTICFSSSSKGFPYFSIEAINASHSRSLTCLHGAV